MLAAECAARDHEVAGTTPHLSSTKILIVDDEPLILELLSRALESAGYRCIAVDNANTALERLRSEEYDLLLADIMMPGMNGVDLMAKAQGLFPDLAVILVTSVMDIDVAIESLKQGAYDYLTKPFDLEQVLISVERALERRRLLQESRLRQWNLEVEVAERTRQLRDALEVTRQNYHSTLIALGTALDSRESGAAGHSIRVAKYGVRLGRHMGLSQAQTRVLEQAAILHDIGKLGIPEQLLRKSGKLTPEEESTVRRHPEIGFHILSGIKYLSEAALVIRHHQERYDGTGYPDGLTGDQIPLCARIFAVAYTLDCLTSDRPFRTALSFEDARDEIRRSAGSQLDPGVVSAFLEIPVEELQEIRREIDDSINSGSGLRQHAFMGRAQIADLLTDAGDGTNPPSADGISKSPLINPGALPGIGGSL